MLGLPLASIASLQSWEKDIQEALEAGQFNVAERLARRALTIQRQLLPPMNGLDTSP